MINARQVNILRPNSAGTWTTLDQYMNRKRVLAFPWKEVQSVSVSAEQFARIDSTTHLPGVRLAVLTATPPVTLTTNQGVCAALLAGPLGASTANYSDSVGNILNLVPIRDSFTHNEITCNVGGEEFTVYGLIQCASGSSEGAAIGASGAENTQISFVYVAGDGTLTLTAISETIDFCVNKVYIESQQPDVLMEGGRSEEMVVEPKNVTSLVSSYVVTVAYASGEVVTITTGNGSGSGRATPTVIPSGSTIVLPVTEDLWNNNNLYKIRLNGVELQRNVEAEWESSGSFSINYVMDVGDVFEVECPAL